MAAARAGSTEVSPRGVSLAVRHGGSADGAASAAAVPTEAEGPRADASTPAPRSTTGGAAESPGQRRGADGTQRVPTVGRVRDDASNATGGSGGDDASYHDTRTALPRPSEYGAVPRRLLGEAVFEAVHMSTSPGNKRSEDAGAAAASSVGDTKVTLSASARQPSGVLSVRSPSVSESTGTGVVPDADAPAMGTLVSRVNALLRCVSVLGSVTRSHDPGAPIADAAVDAVLWPHMDYNESTPLHQACHTDRSRYAPLVCALLAVLPVGTDVDAQTSRGGRTALRLACGAAHRDPSATAVKALLARGADPHLHDFYGVSPLRWARRMRNYPAVAAMELHAGDLRCGCAPLPCLAVRRPRRYTREHVPQAFPGDARDSGEDAVDRRSQSTPGTPIRLSATSSDALDDASVLYVASAVVKAAGVALWQRCHRYDEEAFPSVSRRIPCDIRHVVATLDRVRTCQSMLRACMRDAGDETAAAVRGMFANVVVYSSDDTYFSTPLHQAAAFDAAEGSPALCALLACLDESTSTDVRDRFGETPLHYACRNHSAGSDALNTAVVALLARGADANAPDYSLPGVLPRDVARSRDNHAAVRSLDRHRESNFTRADVPDAFFVRGAAAEAGATPPTTTTVAPLQRKERSDSRHTAGTDSDKDA